MILEKIKSLFAQGELDGKTKKQLFVYFGITKAKEKDQLVNILNEMEKQVYIGENGGKYYLFKNSGLQLGKLRCHEKGFAFFIPFDGGEDLFIPPKALNGAYQNDTVTVCRVQSSRGSTDEAKVVSIIERGKTTLVGTFYQERTFGFVVPDDKGFTCDIYVKSNNFNNAKSGQKVCCKIIDYPFDKNPEGVITDIIDEQNELLTEETSLIYESGILTDFDQETINQLKYIPTEVSEKDKVGRLDLTTETIITIDGDNSKDFDDAISVTVLANGNFKLGVHIADVSYYVKDETPLDKEAFKRGNSVYLPDRVIPMLPKQLSNGICSLNEGVDRLTVSCIMEIDRGGKIVKYDLANSVIKSKHRMTYKQVQKMIDGDTEERAKFADICELVDQAEILRKILFAKREKDGSVNLESKELEIFVDQNKKIVIEDKKQSDANDLIEEFMLCANKTVAEHCFYLDLPFVYRIHEKPEEEKLLRLIEFLRGLGVKTNLSQTNCYSKQLNDVLKKVKGQVYEGVVNDVMLRSMQKAKYSTQDVGHFGLAIEHYCHFTSPIRRYPDLMVHRVLKTVLADYENIEKYRDKCEQSSLHSSETERAADKLERDIDDLYCTQYMRDYIGEQFDGIISGVTSFGVFVTMTNLVEGLIKIEDLPHGNYIFDEKKYVLASNKNEYKLGEKIKVKVIGCDISARRIYLKP